jgi:hypothetical protein
MIYHKGKIWDPVQQKRYVSSVQRIRDLPSVEVDKNLPFFPHPLKPKVTHMHSEPLRESTGNLDVQAVSKQDVQLPDRLADSRTDSRWREFTELGDECNVVHCFVWWFGEQEEGAEDCLMGKVSG